MYLFKITKKYDTLIFILKYNPEKSMYLNCTVYSSNIINTKIFPKKLQ